MTIYKIQGNIHDFSVLKPLEINNLLSPLLQQAAQISCECSSKSAPLFVTHRAGNYHLAKTAGSAGLHAQLCKHGALTAVRAASMGYASSALSNLNDEIVFSLDRPLKIGGENPSVVSSNVNFQGASKAYVRTVSSRMTLLGLLHVLWERARLHEHNPNNLLQQPIWPKLRAAAHDLRPKGRTDLAFGLSDIFLLPLHSQTANQQARNFAKLNGARNTGSMLLFVAQFSPKDIADLLNTSQNKYSMKSLLGVEITRYGNAPFLTNLASSFQNEINRSQNFGDPLIAIGIAKPDSKLPYAQISSMALMPVTGHHIPFDSSFEKDLADELINQKRHFLKPLRFDTKQDLQVHPDFILLDVPPIDIAIEVYGMNTPSYLARKAEKIDIYTAASTNIGYWDWNASQSPNLHAWLASKPLPR